jgi:hypothetical protein
MRGPGPINLEVLVCLIDGKIFTPEGANQYSTSKTKGMMINFFVE